jgi:hypothetical protein
MLQGSENKWVIETIRGLDKHTLNMYTPLRARLGTQELSWIRLDFSEMPASRIAKGFRRNGSNDQDYWN